MTTTRKIVWTAALQVACGLICQDKAQSITTQGRAREIASNATVGAELLPHHVALVQALRQRLATLSSLSTQAFENAWASAWTGDSVGEPVNKVADPLVETLTEALLVALPYVESAEDDPAYKAGAVAKVVKQMRAALAAAGVAMTLAGCSAPPVLSSTVPAQLCATDSECADLLEGVGCQTSRGVSAVPLYAREEDQFPGACADIHRLG